MQVRGDRRQLLVPRRVTQEAQDVSGNVGDQADMAEAVLGVSRGAEILVRLSNIGLDFLVVLDIVEGRPERLGRDCGDVGDWHFGLGCHGCQYSD